MSRKKLFTESLKKMCKNENTSNLQSFFAFNFLWKHFQSWHLEFEISIKFCVFDTHVDFLPKKCSAYNSTFCEFLMQMRHNYTFSKYQQKVKTSHELIRNWLVKWGLDCSSSKNIAYLLCSFSSLSSLSKAVSMQSAMEVSSCTISEFGMRSIESNQKK